MWRSFESEDDPATIVTKRSNLQSQIYPLSMIRNGLKYVLLPVFGALAWYQPPTDAATLSANLVPIPSASVFNLTSIGKLDWAQWGYDVTNQFNHKIGAGLISNFSTIGTNSPVSYATN